MISYDQAGVKYNQIAYTYEGLRLWQRTWSESRQGSAVESFETSIKDSDVYEADVEVER